MAKRKRPRKSSGSNQANLDKLPALLKGKVPTETYQYDADGKTGAEEVQQPRVVTIRTTQVCWAIPMDEITFAPWVTNLLFLRPMPWDEVITIKNTYLPDARNKLHNNFLTEANADWLFMLDSDVCPPPDAIERLIEHTKNNPYIKMIGGWYRVKGEPYSPVVYKEFQKEDETYWYQQYDETDIKQGLEKVEGAGAGCWLMSREVAEAIGENPYSMDEGGEDLTLCRNVRKAGYDIWIDWKLACAHAGVALA